MDTSITLRHLQHVVLLADELHFRRAAERANLSQTAFSRSIQVAEEGFGLRLFDRDTRTVRVTPAGEQLVAHARMLLAQATDLGRRADDLANAEGGSLAFGATLMAIDGVLPGVLPRFRSQRPRLVLTVEVGQWQTMHQHLAQERIEFYVGYPGPPEQHEGLELLPLPPQPASIFCRAGHPLLRARGALSGPQLAKYPWALVQMPGALATRLRALLHLPPPAELPLALSCDNQSVLREALLTSDTLLLTWHAWLSRELTTATAVDLVARLRPHLPPDAMQLDCAIVRPAGRTPSPAAAKLTEMILES